jgi:hypothetical protein
MKKCSPFSGQNDKLVHWWLLVHYGHLSGLWNKKLKFFSCNFFTKKSYFVFFFFFLGFFPLPFFSLFLLFLLPCFFSFCWFFFLIQQVLRTTHYYYYFYFLQWNSLVCFFVFGGVKEPSLSFFCHHRPFSKLQWSSM